MRIFLAIVFVILYILIGVGVVSWLSSSDEDDLLFLSERNATLVIENAIPIGIVWPIFLLILIICAIILIVKLIKNTICIK